MEREKVMSKKNECKDKVYADDYPYFLSKKEGARRETGMRFVDHDAEDIPTFRLRLGSAVTRHDASTRPRVV